MKKVWAWLKKYGALLLGGVLALLGAGWLWSRSKSKLGKVKDELAVAEATKEIARLKSAREAIERMVGEKGEALTLIDQKLDDNRLKIIQAHEGGEDMTDEELATAFADLGV